MWCPRQQYNMKCRNTAGPPGRLRPKARPLPTPAVPVSLCLKELTESSAQANSSGFRPPATPRQAARLWYGAKAERDKAASRNTTVTFCSRERTGRLENSFTYNWGVKQQQSRGSLCYAKREVYFFLKKKKKQNRIQLLPEERLHSLWLLCPSDGRGDVTTSQTAVFLDKITL